MARACQRLTPSRTRYAWRPAPSAPVRLAGHAMGTTWFALLNGEAPALPARRAIERAFAIVVDQMSNWDPTSHLSRINAAPCRQWLDLPPELAAVMDMALALARASDGAFDPTLGALTSLWGFGPVAWSGHPPPPDAVSAALARSGHRHVRVDRHRLWKERPVSLDLCGIAKGYAVDLAAQALGRLGIADFLIELGGEVRGDGTKPDGSPWLAAIEAPPGLDAIGIRIALSGLATATSGDYRRCFTVDGRVYAHGIDLRTGSPADNDLIQVSVVHPSCAAADGWATALILSGSAAGTALADRHGLAALFILRDGPATRLLPSRAFRAMIGREIFWDEETGS